MGKSLSILLCIAVAALVVLGIVMLASASSRWDDEAHQYARLIRQLVFLGIGLGGLVTMSLVDYRLLRKLTWFAFGLVCLALILCYFPQFGDEAKGENRWIVLPVIGRFQPSEAAKLVLMMALAWWFARYQAEVKTFWRGFVAPSVIIGVPVLLIFFETDLGTAFGLGSASMLVLFVAGTRWRYLIVSSVGAGILGWQFVLNDPIRLKRITAFLDLEAHRTGVGWQQWWSIRAFGNGGVEGLGLGNGLIKQSNFPEHHTDFIFPIIGEELGVFFTLSVVLCFIMIFLVGMAISLQATDRYGATLGVGITAVIVIPAMLNIGVTTASLPNTGLPLPFVSFGGTNLVFSLAMIGVLLGIHRRTIAAHRTDIPEIKREDLEMRL